MGLQFGINLSPDDLLNKVISMYREFEIENFNRSYTLKNGIKINRQSRNKTYTKKAEIVLKLYWTPLQYRTSRIYHHSKRSFSTAYLIRPTTHLEFVLSNILLRWVSTVLTLTYNFSAISLFEY